MALHYLDPEREPRECPRCKNEGMGPGRLKYDVQCQRCRGTGRIGVEGAEADVEIFPKTWKGSRGINGGIIVRPIETVWYWAQRGTPDRGAQMPHGGPYPTESAALEAARKAAKGTR